MRELTLQRKKTGLGVLIGFVVLGILIFIGSIPGRTTALTATKADTTEERRTFLLECGWETDPASEKAESVHIPERFTAVYESYNELQRQQGYDLADYAGRDCTLYSYTVLNYPDDTQTVIADLYVYNGRIIGGDVHSTRLDGFMVALK